MDSWHLWILTCPNPAHGRISGVSTISRLKTCNLSLSNWGQNYQSDSFTASSPRKQLLNLEGQYNFYPDIIAQLLDYFQAMV